MKTNWDLVRELMNTAIDACEAIDKLGVTENNRQDTFTENGQCSATMWEFLQSSWIAPENITYSVIQARHELGKSKPYTDELGRTLLTVGKLCSELVGLEDTEAKVANANNQQPQSVETMIKGLCAWYKSHFIPSAAKIMNEVRNGTKD